MLHLILLELHLAWERLLCEACELRELGNLEGFGHTGGDGGGSTFLFLLSVTAQDQVVVL